MPQKVKTDEKCPQCGATCYIDTWKPPKGHDSHLRRFICSNMNHEFYKIIKDPGKRKAYDRQLSR